MNDLADPFVAESRRYLADVHLPRLRRAVDLLPADDLWWCPRPDGLSVGRILLHLEGNVHQWILEYLGGEPYARDRDAEFAATDGPPASELLAALEATVQRACAVIGGLEAERLAEPITIRGMETTVLGAVYHVVEHFAWHAGQALWIAKARAS